MLPLEVLKLAAREKVRHFQRGPQWT